MTKGRLEAFSDGVLAIIITIMVLELRPPEGTSLQDLEPLLPKFAGYILSFIFLAIYWNNHHHMLQATHKIRGPVLWANMHLLFWLSLIPFGTAWMGEHAFTRAPVAFYGIILLGSALAYGILEWQLVKAHGPGSEFAQAVGDDLKPKVSLAIYSLAVLLAWFLPIVACCLYVVVAALWLIPDRRFEKV